MLFTSTSKKKNKPKKIKSKKKKKQQTFNSVAHNEFLIVVFHHDCQAVS